MEYRKDVVIINVDKILSDKQVYFIQGFVEILIWCLSLGPKTLTCFTLDLLEIYARGKVYVEAIKEEN